MTSSPLHSIGFNTAYVMFSAAAAVVWLLVHDVGYSTFLTLGAALQCLGFVCLAMQVVKDRSMKGISVSTLMLTAVALSCRLVSSLFAGGYVPLDSTGDWLYQLGDVCSLALAAYLLNLAHGALRHTREDHMDTFSYKPAVIGSVMLGVLVHGDLNDCVFFDTTFAVSMNLDTIALLPQLWMLHQIGREVEGLTTHFTACLALSRAAAFAFWVRGYKELRDEETGWNWAGWQLVTMHGLSLLVAVDFLGYYVYSKMRGERMRLPQMI